MSKYPQMGHFLKHPADASDVIEEEVDEIEEEELEEEEAEQEKATKTRKTLSEENKYVFTDKDKAKTALDGGELKYKDDSTVEGFRVWEITKNTEWSDDGALTSGSVENYILARSQHQAMNIYSEKLGLLSTLAFKKDRGGSGRAKSKVTEDVLKFGKLMAQFLMVDGDVSKGLKEDADPSQIEQWKEMFESTEKYAHYLNEDKTWKEAN